jgi:hypothetical protein
MFRRSEGALSALSPVLVIVLVWIATIALLFALQTMGFGIGLSVIPLGEDRVWTQLLTNNSGFAVQRQWWQLASRNPLAPWWYWGVSPLILALPESLYAVRKLLDLFLAVSVFLLINQIGRGKSPRLALACGILVLLWNFSGYLEQIMITMLIALGFSVLSVFFYCRYLDGNRKVPEHLVLSLLLFFVALGTYSIQSGVPLAVFFLAMLRRPDAAEAVASTGERFQRAVVDTALYVGFFVLFTQIWITTSGATSSFFKLDASVFWKNLWSSIVNFLWHEDTTELVKSVADHWTVWSIAGTLAAATGFFFWLLWRASVKPLATDAGQDRRTAGAAWLCVGVILALVAPTIVLETTTTLWYPGSRSRMVQQVFEPVIYLAVVFTILAVFQHSLRMRSRAVETGTVALLCAFATVLGLEYNRQLMEQTALERNLEKGLKAVVPAITQPTHFIVRVHDAYWYGGRWPAMTTLYAQTIYKSASTTLDAIYAGSSSEMAKPVTFGEDSKGVYSPARATWVPYIQVIVLDFDGTTVLKTNPVDAKDFDGFQAKFARERPLLLQYDSRSVKPTCPTSLDFDATPTGSGWSVPERSPMSESFVWMADVKANVTLKTGCAGPVELRFRTLPPMALDILGSLRVSVDGANIPLAARKEANGSAEFSGAVALPEGGIDRPIIVEFSVNRTIVPEGGDRALAIPFEWLRLEPKSKLP